MKHWNLAPTNPSAFTKNNIPFALTAHKLKSVSDFNTNLQKAIKYGLNKTDALAALTTVPAKLLGKSNEIGNLQKGSYANFMITSGDIFEAKTTLYEHWIMGNKNEFSDMNSKNISGDYELAVNNKTYTLTLSGKAPKFKAELKQDTIKLKSKMTFKDNWLNIHFSEKDANSYTRLIAKITKEKDNISGKAILANGMETTFTGNYSEPKEEKKKKKRR